MDAVVSGVLVVRAWLEPAGEPRLRISVVEVRPGMTEHRVLAATSADAVCEAVRQWVADLERAPGQQAP